MNWRAILLDIPARIVTLWWTLYSLLLVALFMVLASLMIISLALAAFGIRWGW